MFISWNINLRIHRFINKWSGLGTILTAMCFLLASCDSVLNGNLPRTSELLETQTQAQVATILKSTGNTRITSLKASFVATSQLSYDTLGVGSGVLSTDEFVFVNGRPVARIDNGKLNATEHSTIWDAEVEVPSIDFNIDSSTGKESFTATINAFPLVSSLNNQKLLNLFKITVLGVQLRMNNFPHGTFLDSTTKPPTLVVASTNSLQWEYEGLRPDNINLGTAGGGIWVRNKQNKTINILRPMVETRRIGNKVVTFAVICQYILAYE